MFTETIIQKLKQNNISVDAEKTRERTSKAWKSASKENQSLILALAGVSRATVQRAYKTGNISAKLVVPFAQTLDLSPQYLIGASDDCEECSEQALRDLLTALKYDKLLVEYDKEQRKQSRKLKRLESLSELEEVPEVFCEEPEPEAEPEAVSCEEAECGQDFVDSMTEDDMILLMKSLLLRAKIGGKYAELVQDLKRLLLS